MKIFLVGGGTGGPTTPLLAVGEELLRLKPKAELFFVGHKKKFEKKILESTPLKIKYLSIPAGKWRRYFSLKNIIDIFKLAAGFLKSFWLLRRHRPNIVFGAGSFVQVPLGWAAYLTKIPVVIHQPDLALLLSTRLTAPAARAVSVTFDLSSKELSDFSGLFKKIHKSKIVVTGNPVRSTISKGTLKKARGIFRLNPDFPVLLVLGGGTGALTLNRAVLASFPELLNYVQVIHITGGKMPPKDKFEHPHYHSFDFLGDELKHAYAAANIVISRGGMATISELAMLGKIAIIVPLPDSPQEDNVRLLALKKAAVGVFEEYLTPQLLIELVRKILWDKEIQDTLRKNIQALMPKDSRTVLAKLLIKQAKISSNGQ